MAVQLGHLFRLLLTTRLFIRVQHQAEGTCVWRAGLSLEEGGGIALSAKTRTIQHCPREGALSVIILNAQHADQLVVKASTQRSREAETP